MSDPLLSSLCRICNIQVPKYTCPRCSLQTCSLACSKRHKLWSSCNGERDPTVYKPPSQLATPAGIDHDYNFLHGIEHRIERSEKEIVEDRGLVSREELARARGDERGVERRPKRRGNEIAGEAQVQRDLRRMGIVVYRAPKGMQRSRENGTSWGRGPKCISWQVEWMCDDGQRRALSKVLGKSPVREAYLALLEEHRRSKMTDAEKQAEKKRKAVDLKNRTSKRVRTDETTQHLTPITILQDPETGSWSSTPIGLIPEPAIEGPSEPAPSFSEHLYLLHPRTPSSFPRVLIPLELSESLDHQLRRRAVLEFPTIYVLESGPDDLPEQFMLEEAYVAAAGRKPTDVNVDKTGPVIEEMSNSGEDGSSSSDSDQSDDGQDAEMEEGEIV